MKKILLSLILLLIFSISFAQIPGNIGYSKDYSSSKNFGFKGGVNFSNVHGKNAIGKHIKMKFGFNGGLFYEYILSDKFSIQPEIFYSMKGFKLEFSGYDDENNFTGHFYAYHNLNYLEIPILSKLNVNISSNIKPSIYFGPCFGFKVSSTYRIDDEDIETMEDINVFEFSLVPGVLLEFNNRFILDFRYSIGLTGIHHFEDEYVGNYDPVKNSVISLMLGVKL